MATKATNRTAGFTSQPKEEIVDFDLLKMVVSGDPETANDIRNLLLKRGSVDISRGDRFLSPTPGATATPTPTAPTPTAPSPVQTEDEQTNFEIDTRLQILISSIPIAHPGNIITSEYHNALRDAVRALASRIGLSVNPTAEFTILTFAPNFLPVKSTNPDAPKLGWTVTLERAGVPEIGNEDLKKTVSGGFVVQLPDGATIHQMIVRGERTPTAPKPKKFTVSLNRKRLGKDEQPLELINIDLRDIKDGEFELKESVKLTDKELRTMDADETATGITVSKRKAVNNEKWMYYVSGEFLAGDNTAAEKFEIISIQILCIV
jgi:hypothetical protein